MCDALTANLEEKQFFRIKQPCSHAEVMLYLSTFAAAESFFVLVASGGDLEEITGFYVVYCILPPHVIQMLSTDRQLMTQKQYSGEIWDAWDHSMRHPDTIPSICAFSVLGYVTVCLILLIIKGFGATNAEIVKSLRKARKGR